MKRNAIVYTSNGKDYDRLEMSAFSVRRALGDSVDLYCLTEKYTAPKVRGIVLVNPMEPLRDAGFFPDNWNRSWPFEVLYRMAIPLLDRFKDYERVLYLDTDMLLTGEGASSLFDIDLQGRETACAPDRFLDSGDRMKRRLQKELCSEAVEGLSEFWARSGYMEKRYVNSGLVVFNLSQIRTNGLDWYRKRLRWFWEAETRGKFSYPVNSFINVLTDYGDFVDERFNDIRDGHGAFRFVDDAVFRHYVGICDRGRSQMREHAVEMGFFRHVGRCASAPSSKGVAEGSRQLVMFVCHNACRESVERYMALKRGAAALGYDIIWKYHSPDGSLPDVPATELSSFTTKDLMGRPEFTFSDSGKDLRWLSAPNYATLTQAELSDGYDYVWVVEYDVCYSGKWEDFFRRAEKFDAGLLTCGMMSRGENPGWYWWKTDKSAMPCPRNRQYMSYNCISRLSRETLSKILNHYKSSFDPSSMSHAPCWYEHAWATIAMNETSVVDMSALFCSDSYSFRKMDVGRGTGIVPGKLYHAIKLDVDWKAEMDRRRIEA